MTSDLRVTHVIQINIFINISIITSRRKLIAYQNCTFEHTDGVSIRVLTHKEHNTIYKRIY